MQHVNWQKRPAEPTFDHIKVKQINRSRHTIWRCTCDHHTPPVTIDFGSRQRALEQIAIHEKEHDDGVYDDSEASSQVL